MIDAQRSQSIHQRVGHRGGRAVGSRFTDAFDAQGIERIRRYGLAE